MSTEKGVNLAASKRGLTLRALRETAGLTQKQLAAAAGVRLATLSELETGTTTDPRLSTLAKLADALGVKVADLLADD